MRRMSIAEASERGTYQLLQGANMIISTGSGEQGEDQQTGAVASPFALMTSVAGLMDNTKD
jgi:hypothetical protein